MNKKAGGWHLVQVQYVQAIHCYILVLVISPPCSSFFRSDFHSFSLQIFFSCLVGLFYFFACTPLVYRSMPLASVAAPSRSGRDTTVAPAVALAWYVPCGERTNGAPQVRPTRFFPSQSVNLPLPFLSIDWKIKSNQSSLTDLGTLNRHFRFYFPACLPRYPPHDVHSFALSLLPPTNTHTDTPPSFLSVYLAPY